MSASDRFSVADLLVQARGDAPRALDELFARCRNYLAVVARAQVESWLQAKVDASDLVQQTMLEAYRDFADFRGTTDAEWLAWLRRILCRNAANFVRQYHGTGKRDAGREVPLGPPGDTAPVRGLTDLPDDAESPSQHLLRRERELLVADALTRLAPDHREVIFLRNLQRLPFEEVARRMGRSRPAVQMLWVRALAQLERHLGAVLAGEA